MRRWGSTIFVVLVLLAPLPPFFTNGACTAEFQQAGDALQGLKGELLTLSRASAYLTAHQVAFSLVSAQRCEDSPPRDVEVCPGGPILLIEVPVRNRVCRYYRDASIRQQLGFNSAEQLVHVQSDMNPYRFARISWLNLEVAWGK
jgi:hypothetical protein